MIPRMMKVLPPTARKPRASGDDPLWDLDRDIARA